MESLKKLIVIGAGGFGREVAFLIERINRQAPTWELLGFLDDVKETGISVNGYPVLGDIADVTDYPDVHIVCAVGSSKGRRGIIERVLRLAPDTRFATLIDPSVEYSSLLSVGVGSILCAHTIVTVNVTIGAHVIVNLDCTVAHDVVLGDFVTLYPSVNVSGNTTVGNSTELGTGTQVIQGKHICSDAIIGAGSVIIRDITESGTYVGVPSRKVK